MSRSIPKRPTLAFPWPSPDESAGPAIRTVIEDPVWTAIVRQGVMRWRAKHQIYLPLTTYADTAELPIATSPTVTLVEVDGNNATGMASWLRSQKQPSIALLARHDFADPAERLAIGSLLQEASVHCVAETPLDFLGICDTLLDEWKQEFQVAKRDPLDDLPLPCWGPAWQSRP